MKYTATALLLALSVTVFGNVYIYCDEELETKCLSAIEKRAFATDDRIISCIRDASATCCDAVEEYMGIDSAFANCSCHDHIVTRAMKDSVPKFAIDLLKQRVRECDIIPLSNSTHCNDLKSAVAFGCDDIKPPGTGYSCESQANWGKCGESWMQGYCQKSCKRCEAAVLQEGEALHE